MEKVKKKLKIKLLLILLPGLGGTMFLLIIMMLILGGGTITETTQNTFQLRINERYYQKALTYAEDIREEYEEQKERRKKGKTYKKIFKMDFEEFLTYALYKSDDWEKFNNKYLKEAYKEAEKGRNILNTVENITDLQEMVESAVGSFVGKYERMKISIRVYNDEETGEEKTKEVVEWKEDWGLRAYFPIPKGFDYVHNNDFGAERTYGGNRSHLGNDIMADKGVPIVAVETGIVEKMGWDELGGWRIGIRTKDGSKYYYYAHLEKYADEIEIGDKVNAGQIIGYVGDSGYGSIGTMGKFEPHLHLQIQVKYKIDGQEENIWIDPYSILRFLENNKAKLEEKDGKYRCVNEIRLN